MNDKKFDNGEFAEWFGKQSLDFQKGFDFAKGAFILWLEGEQNSRPGPQTTYIATCAKLETFIKDNALESFIEDCYDLDKI